MIDYAGYVLISLGALFIFLAALSAVRFSDFHSRLNALVKLSAFGMLCLAAGVLTLSGLSATGIKAVFLLIIMLVLLPAEAQMLSELPGDAAPDEKNIEQDDK